MKLDGRLSALSGIGKSSDRVGSFTNIVGRKFDYVKTYYTGIFYA